MIFDVSICNGNKKYPIGTSTFYTDFYVQAQSLKEYLLKASIFYCFKNHGSLTLETKFKVALTLAISHVFLEVVSTLMLVTLVVALCLYYYIHLVCYCVPQTNNKTKHHRGQFTHICSNLSWCNLLIEIFSFIKAIYFHYLNGLLGTFNLV